MKKTKAKSKARGAAKRPKHVRPTPFVYERVFISTSNQLHTLTKNLRSDLDALAAKVHGIFSDIGQLRSERSALIQRVDVLETYLLARNIVAEVRRRSPDATEPPGYRQDDVAGVQLAAPEPWPAAPPAVEELVICDLEAEPHRRDYGYGPCINPKPVSPRGGVPLADDPRTVSMHDLRPQKGTL